MMDVVYLVAGLLLGALAMWLVARALAAGRPSAQQLAQAQADARVATEKLALAQQEAEKLRQQAQAAQQQVVALTGELATKQSDLKHAYKQLDDKAKELSALNERLTTEFKNIANQLLDEKSKAFTETNKTNIDALLSPLQTKIKEFQEKVEQTHLQQTEQRSKLETQIMGLVQLNQHLSKEANALTSALKGQSKTMGGWGEMILESILESSGLVAGRQYEVQASYVSDDGKRQQPDVIVHYPGARSMVIDAKVSLLDYERYASADDETTRAEALGAHLRSLRLHIKTLAGKRYQDLPQIKTLDFVFLFVPIEPAYLVALQAEPGLWQEAHAQRILLISPTNLIPALQLIANLWRQEDQNSNAEKIAKQAGDLYDKFVGLMDDLIGLGNQMKTTQKTYELAMNKLHEGKGNLIRRAEQMKQLGANASKSLPQSLLDRAAQDED